MLKSSSLKYLENKKNLLAFSAGVDSTALFFLLHDAKINFDIAIVNYGTREQSKEEILYAQNLSKTFDLTCHVFHSKTIKRNFEENARNIRYDFFKQLIQEHHYENLLTAHHLGDRLEWMLMQFCKGAGCVELAGMQERVQRENYALIRPLLHVDKSELLNYLHSENITYFEDESNLDLSIKRNTFRHKYANPLLKEYLTGIKKSFSYIDKDTKQLTKQTDINFIEKLTYFKSSNNKIADIRIIDKYLKQNSFILSAKERELLSLNKTLIVGRKFIINQEHDFIFILPYQTHVNTISKEFKEKCRVLKIEPKLRAYLYENQTAFLKIKDLLTNITQS